MPAPVYSVKLVQATGTTSLDVGPVPPGEVWILRDLDMYCNNGGVSPSDAFLRGALGQAIWWNSNAPGSNYASWRGRQVLNEGEHFFWSSGSPCDVTVSGYQLQAA